MSLWSVVRRVGLVTLNVVEVVDKTAQIVRRLRAALRKKRQKR